MSNKQNTTSIKDKLNAIWKKKGIRILTMATGVSVIGGIVIGNCVSCSGGNTSSSYDDDVNSDDKDTNSLGLTPNNGNGVSDETNSSPEIVETVETSDFDETTESITIDGTFEADSLTVEFDNKKPSYTAEDIVKLSSEFCEYVNKAAVLSHKYYKYEKLTIDEICPVVYLANIDYVSGEEKAKLIENGIISDNINTNVANSFHFFELYHNDALNKIMEGRTDIIDLSLILSTDHDIEVAHTMSKIITDSVNASYDVNYKNYMDTVFYYAGDVTLYNNQYDYSKSIYSSDRSKLSVGADYVLSYSASVINSIAYNKGVSNQYASEMLLNGANDFSNLAGVFNGCKVENETTIPDDKQLTK